MTRKKEKNKKIKIKKKIKKIKQHNEKFICAFTEFIL